MHQRNDSDAETDEPDGDDPLPREVTDRVERLTRLAREAVDDAEAAAYREDRAAILEEYDYSARIRDDEEADVLVLHPVEWMQDGTVQIDRVEDLDRGVEIPLSGTGDADDWNDVESRNRALAETVDEEHEQPHGETAHALADFAGNHYAKPIVDLTAGELAEFREEYLPRNAWPTDEQLATLEESIRLTFAAADESVPGERTD